MAFLRRIGGLALVPLLFVALLFGALWPPPAQAQDKTASIAQGFNTDSASLAAGALVGLKASDATYIELAAESSAERLVGVVSETALVELSSETQKVQVVVSGVATVLVSDINGPIQNGDKITPSPISGVGMKATKSAVIVGTAQANMDYLKTTSRDVTAKDGSTQTVNIATLPTQIDVVFYAHPSDERSYVPEFLQIFANSLAGREVSPLRVLIALLITVLALVSIGVLLYSAVQSSIISIGRNPLSEVAVRKGLLQVGLTIMGILLMAVVVIYLVLIT